MTYTDFDAIIIGSGAGGLSAAAAASTSMQPFG
jgi:phytoene dehydrogenase-like protein